MRALLAVAAASLLLVPAAAAKGLRSATICGMNGCTTVTDGVQLRALPTGGENTAPPPPPAAYFEVELAVDTGGGDENRLRLLYVPSRTLLGLDGEAPGQLVWLPVYGSAIEAMATAARGLEPFRAPLAWPTEVRLVAPGPANGGFDWPLVSGSLLVSLVLGLTSFLLVRRWRQTGATTA